MVECKKKFSSTHYVHFPTKDYGGFMDITDYVCQVFPELCVILRFSGVVVAIIVTWLFLFVVISWYSKGEGEDKKCPRCNTILREQSLDHLVTQPSGEKHIYREFYLTCRCGYSEKVEGRPELIA